MLITTGVVMVYSTSAAIAAREETRRNADIRETADTETILGMTSHSTYFLKRQGLYAILGIIAMLTAYNIDYERYRKYASPALWASFVMLLLVYVPHIGVSVKGSKRWLNLGFQLQVSELAKLTMILYMAKKLTERRKELKSFIRGFLPSFFILALFLGAIVLEPDLGASVMLAVIVYAMWFVSGMRLIHLASLGIAAIPAVIVAIIAEPYRVQRLIAFIDPVANRKDSGWQLTQSLISVGTGGLTGLGLGDGPQKYQFLSEGHTDFIYAGICEEFGLIGGLTIFAIYALFMIQGIRVATKPPDIFGSMIATGITVMIGFQAFVNMYVVLGLLPTKGLTLPLVSYGGSSLLINCAAVGILLNVSRYTEIAAALPARKAGIAAPA
jgi:cell division protein FtsW